MSSESTPSSGGFSVAEGQMALEGVYDESIPFVSIFESDRDEITQRFLDLITPPLSSEELEEIDTIISEAGMDPKYNGPITRELEERLIQAIKASKGRGFWQDYDLPMDSTTSSPPGV